ncbi:hypothetical protein [Nocardiopsis suaedae]|uniref:LemA family protein n=1 Tax=Nocardiopsis suaedae TaxID=3018444 RepID=A0ABT4TU85_9ACTN|nr:hypothetical protein [Nocardiopsis suaedae]MDA2808271.1 hypothetical protein [Nocardiopsis suaedae]
MAVWAAWGAGLVLVLVLVSFYVSWRATRLDRLHTRVETAWAALDAALSRRAAAVQEFSSGPWVEPASAVLLADAAAAARRAGSADGAGAARELAESDLSRTLRAVLEEPGLAECPGGREPLREVEAAAKRVLLARRFHNDAVAHTRQARARRLVRVLRLAGGAPLPGFFEMDDEPPRVPGSFGAL